MRLDLYQTETARIAEQQSALLDEARLALLSARPLTRLEQNGVLHALQILIENAIGKAKQLLKAGGRTVPVSAYDSFHDLAGTGLIFADQIPAWNAAVGLRNRIVHDYMNLDMARVLELVQNDGYRFITDFLLDGRLAPSKPDTN